MYSKHHWCALHQGASARRPNNNQTTKQPNDQTTLILRSCGHTLFLNVVSTTTTTTTTRCSQLCVVRENTQTIHGSQRNSVLTSVNCPHLLSHEMTDQINAGDSDQFTSTDLASTLRAVHDHLAKVFLSCTRGHVCNTSTRVTCLLSDTAQTFQASHSYTSARSSHCIVYTFWPPRFGYQHT